MTRVQTTTPPFALGLYDTRFINVTGDTMGGPLVAARTPLVSLELATKGYVDAKTSGGVAPVAAAYLTLATNATLTAERQLQVDGTMVLSDLGVNSTALLRVNSATSVIWPALQQCQSGLLITGSGLHVAGDTHWWIPAVFGRLVNTTGAGARTADSQGTLVGTVAAGSSLLAYLVLDPVRTGSAPWVVRDITFYFALSSQTQIFSNHWSFFDKTSDLPADIDIDNVPITSGTAHSVSNLPVTASVTGPLVGRLVIGKATAGIGTWYLRGLHVTADSN